MDYRVIQPNAEIRACARQQLKGVWGEMAFTFFIYFLILSPPNIVSTLNQLHDQFPMVPSFPVIEFVLSVAVFLATGPFELGFAGYFLRRLRGEEIDLSNIFEGFYRFWRSFLLMFLTSLFIALWAILLIVPGIVKSLGYSMAFYIMRDNPETRPMEALDKSQAMMKGYKWKFFLLNLSFIGWIFLALLTFGIGFLWLYPYINLSMANFYENLKQHQENPPTTAFEYTGNQVVE